jgi:hypothetical protein
VEAIARIVPTCRMIKLILPRWIANSIEGLNENDTPLPLLLHRILPLHYSSNPQHRAVVDKSEIAVDSWYLLATRHRENWLIHPKSSFNFY